MLAALFIYFHYSIYCFSLLLNIDDLFIERWCWHTMLIDDALITPFSPAPLRWCHYFISHATLLPLHADNNAIRIWYDILFRLSLLPSLLLFSSLRFFHYDTHYWWWHADTCVHYIFSHDYLQHYFHLFCFTTFIFITMIFSLAGRLRHFLRWLFIYCFSIICWYFHYILLSYCFSLIFIFIIYIYCFLIIYLSLTFSTLMLIFIAIRLFTLMTLFIIDYFHLLIIETRAIMILLSYDAIMISHFAITPLSLFIYYFTTFSRHYWLLLYYIIFSLLRLLLSSSLMTLHYCHDAISSWLMPLPLRWCHVYHFHSMLLFIITLFIVYWFSLFER